MKNEALITPDVLKWARKRFYSDVNIVADVTGYSPDRIEAWEEGRDKISIPQLKTLAKA